MEKLFAHRFGGSGNLTGHSFGNLFIAALIEVLGDVEEAWMRRAKSCASAARSSRRRRKRYASTLK